MNILPHTFSDKFLKGCRKALLVMIFLKKKYNNEGLTML